MTEICEHIQQRLLDRDGEVLDDHDLRHLAECPDCGEVQRDAEEIGDAVSQLAAGRDSHRAELNPALKARVREAVLAGLLAADHANAPPRLSMQKEAASATADVPSGWLYRITEILGRNRSLRRRLAFACLFCILGLGVVLGRQWFNERGTIGHVGYASGEIRLDRAMDGTVAESQKLKEGVEVTSLRRGAILHTFARAGCILRLGRSDEVRLALSSQTSLRIEETRTVKLERGSVCLSVTPKGIGFNVITPHGQVRVTGTIFEVTADAVSTTVDVMEGQVQVNTQGGPLTVSEGQTLYIDARGVRSLNKRAAGTRLPDWVKKLLDQENITRTSSFLPSISAKRMF